MNTNYKCSFLQFDITPNVSSNNPAFLQGMAGGLRQSVAVAIPLSIEMCMLEDEHFTKLLFVTADIIGFDKTVVAEVRNHAAKWGIDPEGVVLNASHTHYAPGTISSMHETMGPFYENYAKQIEQIIASNLQNLYNHLEPCNIYCGKAEARIGVNRRLVKEHNVFLAPNPEGVYITATPMIKIDLNSSNRTILWVNHGCHPTGMGSDTRISSDFPGFMKNALKKNGVADGIMFFQGAGGSSKEAQERERTWEFSDNGSDTRQNGLKLADIVKEAIEEGLQIVNGNFYCTMNHMVLPMRETPKSNELMKSYRTTSQATSIPDLQLSRQDQKKTSDGSLDTMSLEVQMVCLGDGLNMLTLPTEPVAELAERIQKIDGFSNSDFFLGYTNGLEGYLTTDKILDEGGYEAEQSHLVYQKPAAFSSGTEKVVISSVQALLNNKKERNEGKGYGCYHKATGPQKAFFVLSSGRCGTMTLAHLLNSANNARVWHHPQPDPIRESLLAWWEKIDRPFTFWRTRSSVIHKSWAQGLIHGETDLLMTPFVNTISEEIPHSKFIILIREPGGFVRSGMRRNYYQGHPWDIGRLRPDEGTEEFKTWAAMDQFEKVCWLWNETYSRIHEMTETLPENRKRIVKFEKLMASPETTKDLFQFLELDGFDEAKIKQILERKLNAQQGGNFPKSIDWNADLHEKAEKQYGKFRKKFGYPMSGEICVKKQEMIVKLEKINRKPKILFLEQQYQSTGGHLDHIVAALADKYHVKYLKTLNPNEALSGINWADIVWLEWANQMTIHATNIPQIKNKKVVCRLHGYEVFTDMPTKIKWDNVHRLIFVANHKKELFNSKVKKIQTKQIVIRNGIDLEKFTIHENKKNTKRLVLLGHLNFRKGLPILLHFYQQLLKRDPSYFLHIRGEFQDQRLEMASRTMIQEMGLTDKIEFVGWVDDLNAWLADKSHILSFSLEESFHYAIGNGMAAGLKPVIHAWTESRDIWPNEYVFKDFDEFLNIVKGSEYDPDKYRRIITSSNLDSGMQLEQINKLLSDLIDGNQLETPDHREPHTMVRKAENALQPHHCGASEVKRVEVVKKLQAQWMKKSPYAFTEMKKNFPEMLHKGQIKTMKCERLHQYNSLWEVELGVENEETGVFVQFLIFDQEHRQIYFPFDVPSNIKRELRRLAEECIQSPHIKLNEMNRGMIFDPALREDMREKFKEYIWERMYPGTVFTPLSNFLTHMDRYNFVKHYVCENDAIVDAACGIGYGAKYLSQKCSKVCAVDLSSNSLSLAKRYYNDDKIDWMKADVTSLPLADSSMDCFVSMETFEHLVAPDKLLAEMRRVVKKGGLGFMSTPNGQSPRRKMINNPFHVKEYSYEEVCTICRQFFDDVSVYGLDAQKKMKEISGTYNQYDNLLVKIQ